MECRPLGKTGEKVFIIGLGTYGHGDAYGGITKRESIEILHSISDALVGEGKFFIDTAPLYSYGVCEEWIGQFLRESCKNNILVATKGGRHIESGKLNEKDFSPEFLRCDLERSLKRLQTEEIFLYQLHNPGLRIIAEGSVFDVLEDFREAGMIRFYGVSIDFPDEGIAAIDICKKKNYKGLGAIQVIYNILNKSAETDLFPRAREAGIGIIAREPLFRGFLTGKYDELSELANAPPAVRKIIEQYDLDLIFSMIKELKRFLGEMKINKPLSEVAIRFACFHPSVSVVIPGTNKREYIYSNLGAASMIISEQLMDQLKTQKDAARAKIKRLS